MQLFFWTLDLWLALCHGLGKNLFQHKKNNAKEKNLRPE